MPNAVPPAPSSCCHRDATVALMVRVKLVLECMTVGVGCVCAEGFDPKTSENLFLWSDCLGLHLTVILVCAELMY